jgi:putative ABC transport system permease protein
MQGDISHARISVDTIVKFNEIMQMVDNIPYIESSALSFHVAHVKDAPGFNLTAVGWGWNDIYVPAFTSMAGHYPREENEIMTSRHALELLGIANPQIGMEIPLSFCLFNTGEISTDTFILTGLYTDYTRLIDKPQNIFVAHSFYANAARAVGAELLTTERDTIKVLFADAENIYEYIDRLKHELNITENQIVISPAFRQNYDFGNESIFVLSFSLESYIIAAVVAVLIVAVTGVIQAKNKRRIAAK